MAKKVAKPAAKSPAKKAKAKATPPKKAAKKPAPKETKAKDQESPIPPGADDAVAEASLVDAPAQEPDFSKDEDLNLPEKIKELVQLAQDQGHLTISDINEALPKDLITPEKLDEVFAKLKSLEVEIVEQLEKPNSGSLISCQRSWLYRHISTGPPEAGPVRERS